MNYFELNYCRDMTATCSMVEEHNKAVAADNSCSSGCSECFKCFMPA